MDHPSEIEVVTERDAAAYGFTVRVQANGLLHRITPMRDPQQPRFWCVAVFRCSSAGVPDATERMWIGRGGLHRDELKETLGTIRANPSAWLAEAVHHELRAWMLDPQATPPVAPLAAGAGRPPATTTR